MSKAMRPTPSQAQLLAEGVAIAYRAGWKGSMRENARPSLPKWAPQPTRLSLRGKGLLEPVDHEQSYRHLLKMTKAGVEAGQDAYVEKHGVTAQMAVEKQQEENRKREQDAQDRVDKAKHYFRGFKLSRARFGDKSKNAKLVTGHIQASGRLDLPLDDLLVLGEQIEKLR